MSIRGPWIPPPLWALGIGAAMWASNRHFPILTIVPGSLAWLGSVTMVAAAIPVILAQMQFRRARTTINPHKPDSASALVTSGVYRWTRNPMYLGLALLLLGWAIRLGTLAALAGPLLFVPLMTQRQIRVEEQALRALFGAPYEQYCQRVNRWFGRRRQV